VGTRRLTRGLPRSQTPFPQISAKREDLSANQQVRLQFPAWRWCFQDHL